ncbi:MAG: hypothetical protein HOL43_09245 [Verrucomicrobiales bacterium]|jgi:hypothetical protein|nr:hypothetical protein [Gammaproteobacteria bacterium]MBT5322538.1 hypothetical protein [Verrucomicrobiales bacterium]MBT5846193.1 hypothetical protein [Verrucomicrobiales bacterium]
MKFKHILITVLLPVFLVACGEPVSEDAPQGELPANEKSVAEALDAAGSQYGQSDDGPLDWVLLDSEDCDDALLEKLKGCKNLKSVRFTSGTKITSGAISAFKKALPNVMVEQIKE